MHLKGLQVLKKLNEVIVSVLLRQLVSSEKQKHFMNRPP